MTDILTHEAVTALRDNGHTKGPWEFCKTGPKGKPYILYASYADQNWGSRATLISPQYRGQEVDDIWLSISDSVKEIIEAAPSLVETCDHLYEENARLRGLLETSNRRLNRVHECIDIAGVRQAIYDALSDDARAALSQDKSA